VWKTNPLNSSFPGLPNSESDDSQRFFGLDVLRFVAVTLVLHIHSLIEFNLYQPRRRSELFTHVTDWIVPAGSTGVDLFFVLSGFLVSGLLFKEFIQYGTMSFGQFFVRRAFKIYPAFWILIGLTLILRLRQSGKWDVSGLFAELFFVQNYFPGLWGHTWSLAVEEQFYILLIGSFIVLKLIARENILNVHLVPRVFDVVLVGCMIARVLTWWYLPRTNSFHYRWATWVTHLRIDALFFGMLLAYWWYFRWDEDTKRNVMSLKYVFAVAGLILISPIPERLMTYDLWQIFRFVVIYVGAGCLLLAALTLKPSNLAGCFQWMAWLGRHSYSVYLWHMLVLIGLKPYTRTQNSTLASFMAIEAACHAACWAVGIFAARIIEFPVLRLRDKLFPSRVSKTRSALVKEAESAVAV
jgi:peptidoglycan/LPS O-acetylase OafA/YrhL